ncbi:MAG: aldo/keto reductase [Proteobacteria bacterium]|nr:aldo/keto reductase [Pseudomonadota bacterium]
MLVLGTAQLGYPYGIANKTGTPDESICIEVIAEAWRQGIEEFDTAQAYGGSEEMLGKAFVKLGITNKAKVITKFDPTIDQLNLPALTEALDSSLLKLCVPKLYGILLHGDSLLSLWNQGLSAGLLELVSSGRVNKIGMSVYQPHIALEALNTKGIDIIQIPSNVLDQRFEKATVFELAKRMGKQIYIRSVFLQGLLLMRIEDIPRNLSFAIPTLKKIEAVAKAIGLSKHEIALSYIKFTYPTAKVVFGAESSSQVKENCSIWQKTLQNNWVPRIRNIFVDVDERILNPSLWVRA